MEQSDRQISNRTMREGVVFPMNEVNGWKQTLPKDFKTPYEYYEDIIKKGIFSQKVVD